MNVCSHTILVFHSFSFLQTSTFFHSFNVNWVRALVFLPRSLFSPNARKENATEAEAAEADDEATGMKDESGASAKAAWWSFSEPKIVRPQGFRMNFLEFLTWSLGHSQVPDGCTCMSIFMFLAPICIWCIPLFHPSADTIHVQTTEPEIEVCKR